MADYMTQDCIEANQDLRLKPWREVYKTAIGTPLACSHYPFSGPHWLCEFQAGYARAPFYLPEIAKQTSLVAAQISALDQVAAFAAKGKIKPIATTQLDGLTPETMKEAHELVETRRTIGKLVIAIER
jgi:hypothetical protein